MKILACAAVVGLHTLHKDISVVTSTLYYICGFAVPAFFMSSGYMLLDKREVSYSYSIRKILLILKIVCIWSVLMWLARMAQACIEGEFGVENILYLPKTIIKSLVQKGDLWHFWYFGALIILYIMLPLLCRARKQLFKIWLVMLVIGLVIQVSSYVVGSPIQHQLIQTFRLWTWIQYFILGVLLKDRLAEIIKRISFKAHTGLLICWTVLVAVFQNIAGRLLLHNLYAEYFYDSLITVVWLILLFTWVMRIHLSGTVVNMVKMTAPLTMGIYIVHPILLKVANAVLTVETVWVAVALFVVILITSGVCSFIISKIPIVKNIIKL